MIFKSRIDPWLLVLIAIVAPLSLVYGVYHGAMSANRSSMYLSGGLSLVYVGVIFGIIWPMQYIILKDHLVVQYGVIKRMIRFESIVFVHPSMNPISAPALSLHRLRIHCGSNYPLLISPAKQQKFMQVLAQKTPHLALVKGRLIPRDAIESIGSYTD